MAVCSVEVGQPPQRHQGVFGSDGGIVLATVPNPLRGPASNWRTIFSASIATNTWALVRVRLADEDRAVFRERCLYRAEVALIRLSILASFG